MSSDAVEQKARRKAEQHGLLVKKFRENSLWFAAHGPYAIVAGETGTMMARKIEREQLDDVLTEVIARSGAVEQTSQ